MRLALPPAIFPAERNAEVALYSDPDEEPETDKTLQAVAARAEGNAKRLQRVEGLLLLVAFGVAVILGKTLGLF